MNVFKLRFLFYFIPICIHMGTVVSNTIFLLMKINVYINIQKWLVYLRALLCVLSASALFCIHSMMMTMMVCFFSHSLFIQTKKNTCMAGLSPRDIICDFFDVIFRFFFHILTIHSINEQYNFSNEPTNHRSIHFHFHLSHKISKYLFIYLYTKMNNNIEVRFSLCLHYFTFDSISEERIKTNIAITKQLIWACCQCYFILSRISQRFQFATK